MALAIITTAWYGFQCKGLVRVRNFALLSTCLALTALLVTRFGNVPINQLIRTWSPANPPGDWKTILHRWDFFHLIRTIAAIGSFIAFIIATHLFGVKKRAAAG